MGCFRELKNIKNNTINRVFAVFFDESQLYSLISQEQESGKVIFLINNRNQIVTSTEQSLVLADAGVLDESFDGGFSNIQNNTYTNYNGQNYSVIKTEFNKSNLSINGWKLVSLIPAQNLNAAVLRIWLTSIGLSLTCIGFSLVLILWDAALVIENGRGLSE